MIVGFLHSEKSRERMLAEAVVNGVRAHGDEAWKAQIQPTPDLTAYPPADVYCFVGVKSRAWYREIHQKAQAHTLYFDKGYLRHRQMRGPKVWEYWRVALDAHHPTEQLMTFRHPSDRYKTWGRDFAPWRATGTHIVIAGSSEKYHAFYDLPHPTEYAEHLVRKLRKITKREIVYRPKPSWRAAEPIEGTTYSDDAERLSRILEGAWCMVTHGSNAALDAVMAGVPVIVLGTAIARPISSTAIENIDRPYLATEKDRTRWLSALAYWQWTAREIAAGEMWAYVRQRLLHG